MRDRQVARGVAIPVLIEHANDEHRLVRYCFHLEARGAGRWTLGHDLLDLTLRATARAVPTHEHAGLEADDVGAARHQWRRGIHRHHRRVGHVYDVGLGVVLLVHFLVVRQPHRQLFLACLPSVAVRIWLDGRLPPLAHRGRLLRGRIDNEAEVLAGRARRSEHGHVRTDRWPVGRW